jgi:hypothetical protein
METKIRIVWQSNITGFVGEGNLFDDNEQNRSNLKDWVDYANTEHKELTHIIVREIKEGDSFSIERIYAPKEKINKLNI